MLKQSDNQMDGIDIPSWRSVFRQSPHRRQRIIGKPSESDRRPAIAGTALPAPHPGHYVRPGRLVRRRTHLPGRSSAVTSRDRMGGTLDSGVAERSCRGCSYEVPLKGLLMRVVIVYESLYGNTHLVAERVAEGVNLRGEAIVVPVSGATPDWWRAPTCSWSAGQARVHGLSTSRVATDGRGRPGEAAAPSTRHGERRLARLAWHPRGSGWSAIGGLRHPLRRTGGIHRPRLTGDRPPAARHHGFELVVEPESFLVDKENHLVQGEGDRAREWADRLI